MKHPKFSQMSIKVYKSPANVNIVSSDATQAGLSVRKNFSVTNSQRKSKFIPRHVCLSEKQRKSESLFHCHLFTVTPQTCFLPDVCRHFTSLFCRSIQIRSTKVSRPRNNLMKTGPVQGFVATSNARANLLGESSFETWDLDRVTDTRAERFQNLSRRLFTFASSSARSPFIVPRNAWPAVFAVYFEICNSSLWWKKERERKRVFFFSMVTWFFTTRSSSSVTNLSIWHCVDQMFYRLTSPRFSKIHEDIIVRIFLVAWILRYQIFIRHIHIRYRQKEKRKMQS